MFHHLFKLRMYEGWLIVLQSVDAFELTTKNSRQLNGFVGDAGCSICLVSIFFPVYTSVRDPTIRKF